MLILKIKKTAIILSQIVILLIILIFLDKIHKEPSSFNIIYGLILSFAGVYFSFIVLPYITITIKSEGLEFIDISIFKLKFKKVTYFKWQNIINIYPNNIYYFGSIPKAVFIQGVVDGKEYNIAVSNLFYNFKEALLFIEKHVTSDIIDEDVKKLIESYKREMGR
ncbi:MAG: hypothetical protein A2509_11745 [Candidatus Edwardsbacteria bacterium RIFOXYD12_FULL_50_11]|uniref:Uncharacterized protein n=1 Tax=Candidatus Edwardsbacteria bacterium GWF2_54_11 TaxID=1817851 RepID=A0A1F5R0V6_9BACT|nr:MAG: hypothetical protein A2502_04305 [Candidatus Edwardsbacteria bacterium RifOxyC12_full_54_24]OGF08104.1 MAG: hypothetical protein A2024_05090 [Candidatus Edwardsbacteria bacterium GWF2_54_11]OGF08619.1 MAG: hypothetical protein A2273_06685 [Candidatus Edwardsbacteria bacterium RifOxyA12_full_54_48]OGF11263.1 MAG: hypothetical protein A3K15_02750 [Candidatus Edwardsbacteria bacterium GWE2_54_12]OGF16795.1 MAG: hypothetical protein A2509_11745 [Candidatus Edwardsbacteria bacterium RIFOXYD1